MPPPTCGISVVVLLTVSRTYGPVSTQQKDMNWTYALNDTNRPLPLMAGSIASWRNGSPLG